MVNWREDFEFIYLLSVLVSGIIIFFVLYDRFSIEVAGGGVAGLAIVEALIGFVAFETDWAVGQWEKFAKRLEK